MANKFNMENNLLSPLFLVLLFYILPYILIASSSTQEANALLKWKSTFGNETQSLLRSWTLPSHNASTTPCTWFGISCNSTGSVIQIRMSGLGINGMLHDFSFSSFPHLENLDLVFNSLYGLIPHEIGNLKSLVSLYLDSNNLSGPIPHEIGNLKSLVYLIVDSNNLSGPIPHEIGNLKSLVFLELNSNNLSGPIPHEIGNLKSLVYLFLNSNNLSGPIPHEIGNLKSLVGLNLGSNNLSSPIPHEIGNLTSLHFLYLSSNNLFGYIPDLQVLVLRSNKLYGFLRDSEARNSFSNLRILDLSNNNFNGFLPADYFASLKAMMKINGTGRKLEYMGNSFYKDSVSVTIKGFEIELVKILKIFTTVDFSNNSFCGEIPESIGKLQSLHLLNFFENLLTGHIPSSVGNLKALESLDLSSNSLVGEIPRQLASLNFLTILKLSRNQLSGPIPRGSQLDTFGNDSYSDNLGLCGFPLSNGCHRDENETPQSSSPLSEDDTEYGFVWKVGLMGYACGTVLGMIMGYLVFSTGNPPWLVRLVQKENNRKVRRQRKIKKSVGVSVS